MTVLLGAVVVAAAVYAVVRGIDVRLALMLAGLALGGISGQAAAVVRKFFSTLAAEEFLIPICCAMGFAHVLRHTQCDRHLVQVLVSPLRRVRFLLIPGAVVVGFVVNIPIISQTSAAAAMGSVLVPLMLAAGFTPITAGSTLLLGASIGGELLNPGAPEFRTVIREMSLLDQSLTSADCVRAVLPLGLMHLGVATAAFWALSRRAEDKAPETVAQQPEALPQVRYTKALVPLVPLVLLFVAAPPLEWVHVPREWLVAPETSHPLDGRLVGAAMLLGVVAAALADRKAAPELAGAFFGGAGYAVTHIISIIVAASCFGEGIKLIGLDRWIAQVVASGPQLLVPAAGLLPLALAAVSGSGMAATQSLFGLFAGPASSLGVAPELVGAVVSLGAAAGRTMSPVAAVALMCASLSGTRPWELVKRVAAPLLLGIVVVAAAGTVMAAAGSPLAAERGGASGAGEGAVTGETIPTSGVPGP